MRNRKSKEEKAERKEEYKRLRKRYPRHLAIRLTVVTIITLVIVLGCFSILNLVMVLAGSLVRNGQQAGSIAKVLESVLDMTSLNEAESEDEIVRILREKESTIDEIAEAFAKEVQFVSVLYGGESYGYIYLFDDAIPEIRRNDVISSSDREVSSETVQKLLDLIKERENDDGLLPSMTDVPQELCEELNLPRNVSEERAFETRDVFARIVTINDDELLIFFLSVDLLEAIAGNSWYYGVFALLILAATLLLIVVLILYMRKRVVRPLNKIERSALLFVSDTESSPDPSDWNYSRPEIRTKDEIQALSDTIVYMADHMKTSVTDLLAVTMEKERISTELSLATRIQNSMLPSIFPPYPDRKEFVIYASMDPAKEVGGDFYDFFLIDETHLGLVIADVSGKGVPAALFMMTSMLRIQNLAKEGYGPAGLLERVNNQIAGQNTADMFVTVWFGILDTRTGVVSAANAGHEYPAVRQQGGDFVLFKDPHGFVIGEMEDMRYREYEIVLVPGDTLFVYTDGVPEAQNPAEEFFGTDRMLKALNREADAGPEKLIANMKETLEQYGDGAPKFDDATMLCLRYNGSTE